MGSVVSVHLFFLFFSVWVFPVTVWGLQNKAYDLVFTICNFVKQYVNNVWIYQWGFWRVFLLKRKFILSLNLSRASREHVSGLWLWCSDQVGLRCRVLQCSCHLHSHHKEAWRHVPLPGSRHWLLTGQRAKIRCTHVCAMHVALMLFFFF